MRQMVPGKFAQLSLAGVQTVFQDHALPRGTWISRGRPVDTSAIDKTALLTVEGEKDDISGVGQTQAAHAMCPNIPDDRKLLYVQKGAGHYGVFSGKRWESQVYPNVRNMILASE